MSDPWFEEIREAAERRVWSRGVELARAERVRAERIGDDEAVLRVEGAPNTRRPTVTLFLDGGGWDCDCGAPDDPCEHVTAAAIALRRAQSDGRALPSAAEAAGAALRYELRRHREGFALTRWALQGDEAQIFETGLRASAASDAVGLRIEAEEVDYEIEALLGGAVRSDALLPAGLLQRLLRLLARCRELHFEGKPVVVTVEPVGPVVVVDDAPGGFRLYLEQAPEVSELLGEGLALCGSELRPAGPPPLTGRERAELPRGRFYPFEQGAELVEQVIPDLEERMEVRLRSRRLPRPGRRELPRLRIETRRSGTALGVRADIVYGTPARARVERGGLISLSGAIPLRDQAEERALARRVQTDLGLPVAAEVELWGEEALALAERLAGSRAELVGDAHRAFFRAPPLEVAVRASEAGLEARFWSGAEQRQARVGDVLAAWEAGESHVALPGEGVGAGFAPLPLDWLERHGHTLAALLEARENRGKSGGCPAAGLPAWALPDLARFCDELGIAAPAACDRLRALVENFDELPRASLPDDLRARLREYQRRGVDWLCFLREAGLGALLADDMGLGKTVQLLCALRGRSLVIAPTSVLANWAAELARFRPGLRVSLYHGSARRLDPDADVTLTSYALLRLDVDSLACHRWDTVVLDEAQAIKNPASQVARAAYRLEAAWRVSLTGTPVENRLDELWSQLHFTNPGFLGERRRFANRYARPIEGGDATAAAELRHRIRPFVLRREKAAVARELPPRTEVVLRCELDTEERVAYDAVRAATRRDVVAHFETGGGVLGALEALLRLRQAACHRGLLPGQHAERSSKLDLLIEQLETVLAEGHRALVFSQWTGLLDRIEPLLRAGSIAFARLDGSTRDRGAVVEAFQRDTGPPVLLISLRAGGTGLNLTAADHVFFTDPWWNPAVEAQAADRTHRIGQMRPVLVQRLVAADTVEEGILALQERKRAAAGVVGGMAPAAITREELLTLLE